MAIEELKNEMGFKHVTAHIYRHNEYGMVSLESQTPSELVKDLVQIGSYLKQKEIRTALGVNLRGE